MDLILLFRMTKLSDVEGLEFNIANGTRGHESTCTNHSLSGR